eukprot:6173289-Pleurochrysis_carterae.AAC.5
MHQRARVQVRERGEADVRVRADVHRLGGGDIDRAEVVEEDERANGTTQAIGKHATDGERERLCDSGIGRSGSERGDHDGRALKRFVNRAQICDFEHPLTLSFSELWAMQRVDTDTCSLQSAQSAAYTFSWLRLTSTPIKGSFLRSAYMRIVIEGDGPSSPPPTDTGSSARIRCLPTLIRWAKRDAPSPSLCTSTESARTVRGQLCIRVDAATGKAW